MPQHGDLMFKREDLALMFVGVFFFSGVFTPLAGAALFPQGGLILVGTTTVDRWIFVGTTQLWDTTEEIVWNDVFLLHASPYIVDGESINTSSLFTSTVFVSTKQTFTSDYTTGFSLSLEASTSVEMGSAILETKGSVSFSGGFEITETGGYSISITYTTEDGHTFVGGLAPRIFVAGRANSIHSEGFADKYRLLKQTYYIYRDWSGELYLSLGPSSWTNQYKYTNTRIVVVSYTNHLITGDYVIGTDDPHFEASTRAWLTTIFNQAAAGVPVGAFLCNGDLDGFIEHDWEVHPTAGDYVHSWSIEKAYFQHQSTTIKLTVSSEEETEILGDSISLKISGGVEPSESTEQSESYLFLFRVSYSGGFLYPDKIAWLDILSLGPGIFTRITSSHQLPSSLRDP